MKLGLVFTTFNICLSVIFAASAARASDQFSDLSLSQQIALNPQCQVLQTALQLKIAACKTQMQTNKCDSLPDKDDLRNCDKDPYDSTPTELVKRYGGCVEGIFDATIGAIGHIFAAAWDENEMQARYYSREVQTACEQKESAGNVEVARNCKNRILEEFPDLQNKYSKILDQTKYQVILDDVHKRLDEIQSRQPSLKKFLQEHPDNTLGAMATAAEHQMDKWHLKMQCYSPAVRAELRCAALMTIVGVGFTAYSGAAAVIKAAQMADVAEAAAATANAVKAADAEAVTTSAAKTVLNSPPLPNNLALSAKIQAAQNKIRAIPLKENPDHVRIFRDTIETATPAQRQILFSFRNHLLDKDAWADYSAQLIKDAAAQMRAKAQATGNTKLMEAADKGEITRNAVLQVLVQRAKARGRGEFSSLIKTEKTADFNDKMKKGPFFEKGVVFEPDGFIFESKKYGTISHGIDSHVVQQDFMAKEIAQKWPGGEKAFYEFAAKNPDVWTQLYDRPGTTRNATSPAFVQDMLGGEVPLK